MMYKIHLLIVLLTISLGGYGQKTYVEIDKQSQRVPDSLVTYQQVATHLTQNLTTDTQKARAIYTWIAHNITYDLSQMNTNKRYESSQELLDEVWTKRRGICQHYSELFLAMSQYVGLKSYLIAGYVRDSSGAIAAYSHAWNALVIDDHYYLVDVTWAAGYELKGKYIHQFQDAYFLIPPKEFIKDHMPFDPMWQFVENPLTHAEFIAKKMTSLDKRGSFMVRDSIAQYQRLSRYEQLKSANRRILACGVKNKQIQKQVDENTLQLTNLTYQVAVDTLNYGVQQYNLYILHKNRQFHNPNVSDEDIQALLDNASKGLYAADKLFYNLFSPYQELNALIVEAKKRMPSLLADLEREKEFVADYLKKWKPLRPFSFVK